MVSTSVVQARYSEQYLKGLILVVGFILEIQCYYYRVRVKVRVKVRVGLGVNRRLEDPYPKTEIIESEFLVKLVFSLLLARGNDQILRVTFWFINQK